MFQDVAGFFTISLLASPSARVNSLPSTPLSPQTPPPYVFQDVVGVAAMVADGLGLIANTKAAVLRLGLCEIKAFAHLMGISNDPLFTAPIALWDNFPNPAYFQARKLKIYINSCKRL